MKYIKHIILTAFAMVVMMGAWAQTVPTKQSDGTWTFTMPDANQLLEVEYNPVLTLRTNNSTMGTVALEPIEVPVNTAEFNDILSDWENDNNNLTEEEMPSDFVASTLAQASAWSSAPTSGWAYLIYDFNDNGTPKYVVFLDGEYRYNDAWNISHQTIYYHNYYYTTASVSPVVDNLDGTYNIVPGTTVTITAMAAERYHFVNWTDPNNNVIGTSTPIQVTVNSDTTIQGNFANNPLLTFGANDPAMGTVVLKPVSLPANAAEFSFPNEWNGDFNNLTANDLPSDFVPSTLEEARAWSSAPTTGYVTLIYGFNDVTGATKLVRFNDGVYSTNAETNFLHRDLNPIYGKFYYTIASIPPVVANNDGSYSVIPGTEVTVKATPNDGHYFVEWEDESTKTSHTVTVTRDTNLIATFNAYATLQIASNNEQMGTVALQNDLTSDELTVIKDVNAQSEWFPLNTRYLRYYPSTSQHIIPADSLAAMAGKVITGVKYYTENTNLPYEPPMDITVYLAEVDYTSFNNNLEDLNNCTEVYTGTLSATSVGDHGEMTITFSNPFTYGGSNLLVSMSNEIVGSAYNFDVVIDFRGKNSYNDSSSIFGIPQDNYIETSSFLPLCTFTYKEAIPNPDGGYWFIPGSEATVVATPATDRHFVNWTNEDPAVIDGDATKTFTVAGDTTLTANFAIDTVRLDSVRLTWQVQIGDADPISPTPYVTVNPTAADTMGYVLIPKNADVVITPSDGQKELVSKLDLIPIGAINGKFSVGSNKQVYFSKGNLQYTKSTNVWSFMEHQYSMVETADQNVGAYYANQNVVSLFGWGTSGYEHGATCYQPNCTNIYPQNYYAYGDAQKSLFDESGKADWGYNAISNGGNTENSGWRTLTNKEWVWLLGPTYANSSPTPGTNCRTSSTISGTPNARFAKANLFGTIHGLIIFPDNYTHPEGVDAPTGINMKDATSWNANTYTSADWAKMEAAGAVFLPAAGRRPTNVGSSTDAYTVMYVGNTGCYWSSTDSTNDAQQVLFGSGNNFIVDGSAYRSDGHSVRLVKMATVSASAQTDPYVPARNNNDNSWAFKMPTSDLMLRTAWKQDAGLAYAKADTTVYRGLSSTVQNPLTKPNGISVTYSITPESGTTTNNVINPSTGEVTIHGTGIDTVKARFAGNNDYLPDSAMYILRTLEPWKLTLATVGDGTVVVPPSYTLTFSGTDNNYNPIVVNNYDGTSFSTSTLGNSGMGVSAMLSALYGSNSINPASCTPTEHVSTSTPWIVVTGTFSTAETMIFTDNNLNNRTITVSCTPNMNGIDVDPNNSNKYYVVPGTEVTVKATANEHYHFTKWTSGSTEMALTETMSFTVTSDTTVTANFAGNVYTVTANTNGNGSVTGGGSITYPNSATLVATANEHYHFVNWTSPSNVVLGTETTLVVQPTSDSTVYANFAIDTFELSFGPLASTQNAHGSVDFDGGIVPAGVVQKVENSNPVPGTYKVPYGTKVTLKATPDADYHLLSWTYSDPTMTHVEDFEQDTTTITVTGAQTVEAVFAIDSSRLDSVRTTWDIYIDGAQNPINSKAYSATDTMGYVMIPVDANVVITPQPEAQAARVSKLELVEPCIGKVVNLSSVSKDTVLTCGDTLTGTLAGKYRISIADGATVTLNDVSINYPSGSYYESGFAGITCLGDATIILKDGTTNNVAAMDYRYPGIQVGPTGKTLTIQGTGTLNAKYRKQGTYDISYGCGIGGGGDLSCGNIVIDGGTINAEAFHQAAGIGSGCCRTTSVSCGTITINGGIVTATGGVYAAGIGTGYAEGGNNSCGAISINGGTITATGGQNGAGIGTGDAYISNSKTNTCASITITDGVTQVTATKGSSATNSIGAGNNGTCGTITIDPSLSDVTSGNTRTISHTPSVPTGAINGKFSVSSNKQVYFSQGNLQYTKSTGVWSFMEHQYSTVETTGSYCTNDYGNRDVVSLFGWATSGYNHGATCYQPYSTNPTNDNYYAYGNASYNLYDQTGQADWGYNAISNGGNTVNSGWRTLTTEEWQYLFANHTKGWSTVNGVNGYVIRPDGVSTAIAASYTASAWETEEAAGAVFLPAAGYRNSYVGTDVYNKGSIGRYWSSSADGSNANYVNFSNSSLGPDYTMNRNYGLSVRLVKDAN